MQEIELKLRIKPQDIQKLINHPLLVPFAASQTQKQLFSAYYDTPNLALFNLGLALRVRKIGNQFIQTVKTAGTVEEGMHVRSEWEYPVSSEKPNIHLLPEKIKEKLLPFIQQLECIFVTEFSRLAWQLTLPEGVAIELALDQGEIRSSVKWVEPILEVELEIKEGKSEGIMQFAKKLKETMDLRPFDQSKAERGYRLYKLAQFNS